MTEPARHWSLSWRTRVANAAPWITANEPSARGDGVVFRSVWRDPPNSVRADVKALWRRLNVLPDGVDVDQRAGQVCVVGYKNDALVAVCTAELTLLPRLGQRFAMIRILVAPEHRTFQTMWGLVGAAFSSLQAWSLRAPDEKVMGLGAIIQNPDLAVLARRPAWPVRHGDPMNGGLVLVGYTERSEQIRVAWFDHARV